MFFRLPTIWIWFSILHSVCSISLSSVRILELNSKDILCSALNAAQPCFGDEWIIVITNLYQAEYTLYWWKCIDPCSKWNNGVWNVTFRLEGEPVSALSGSVCEHWCSGALCSAERLLPAASDLRSTPWVCTQCCAALLLQLWAGFGNDDDLYFFKVTVFVFF